MIIKACSLAVMTCMNILPKVGLGPTFTTSAQRTQTNHHLHLTHLPHPIFLIIMHPSTILCLLLTPLLTSALGINCRGSSDCDFATTGAMSEIIKLIDSMSDSTCVTSGEQIACFDAGITSICAFTQKTGATVCGGELKTLIGDLQGHGCGECGSVPLGYPGTNDVSNGELTVNAAEDNCRGNPPDDGKTGLCPGIS